MDNIPRRSTDTDIVGTGSTRTTLVPGSEQIPEAPGFEYGRRLNGTRGSETLCKGCDRAARWFASRRTQSNKGDLARVINICNKPRPHFTSLIPVQKLPRARYQLLPSMIRLESYNQLQTTSENAFSYFGSMA